MVLIIPVGLAGCAAPAVVSPVLPTPAANPFQTTTAGDTTVVAVSPPSTECCPEQTLPQYLGVTQCVGQARTTCGRVLSCFGFLFPGLGDALQPGPPLLPITDPANLSPDAPPAVQTAAKIKAEEDQAAQKVQALRYLATIGCAGCYPGVEEAFLAAMDDCTEEVRYEAILAIRKTTCCHGEPCECCGKRSCCSEKLQKKLVDIAYGTDDTGTPKECSDRVRRQARLALEQCGPPVVEPTAEEVEPERPTEGPTEGPAEGPNGAAEEGAGEEESDEPTNGEPADGTDDGTDGGEEAAPAGEDTTAQNLGVPAPRLSPTIQPAGNQAAMSSQLRLLPPVDDQAVDSPPTIRQ